MKHRTTYAVGLATLLTVLASAPLAAEDLGSGAGPPQPVLLRISGFVGRAPTGVPTLGTFTLGVQNSVVTLELSSVQTLNGPLTEGPAALRQFALYDPNLLVVGDRGILRRLTDAVSQTQITLFGYVHQGARRMLVVQVDTV